MTQSGHRRLQFAVAQPCGLEATLNKGIAIRAMAKAAQVYVEIACSPKIAVAEAFRVVQHRNDFRARCEVRRLSRPSAQARCDDTSKLWPKRFPEYSALPPAPRQGSTRRNRRVICANRRALLSPVPDLVVTVEKTRQSAARHRCQTFNQRNAFETSLL